MAEPEAKQTQTYPSNSLRGLPLELRDAIIDLLPTAAQKQIRLVDKSFKMLTSHIFKHIVIPETAGRKEGVIPNHLFKNTTSITIPKKQTNVRSLDRRHSRLVTVQTKANRKTVATAISQPFINRLFSAPLINQVCIQHPISSLDIQTIFNSVGTRLRSLAITGDAYLVTLCKRNGFKELETSDAISELEELILTPMLHSVIGETEENIIAGLIHRSSATLHQLDLSWGLPIQLSAIPDALDKCRNLTALNLNGYTQSSSMLPFILTNNSRLKSLCLLGADIADEPADGIVARALLAFTGVLNHLEITCLRALPSWFPSVHCIITLNSLVIETQTVDLHFTQWILQLVELRNVKFISAKFESLVNYTHCLPRVAILKFHNCELSFASLGELIQPMSALTNLTFSNVYMIDPNDDATYDLIHTTLNQPAIQSLRHKFAGHITTAIITDITMRLWLHSRNELISDEEPVPLHLHQKWLESRSQDYSEPESDLESDEMVSTDEEYGIVESMDDKSDGDNYIGESEQSDDNDGNDDDDDGDSNDDDNYNDDNDYNDDDYNDDDDAFAKDEIMTASPSLSITPFLLSSVTPSTFVNSLDTDEQLIHQPPVSEELLFREDHETKSSSSIVLAESDLNTSHKRDRIQLDDSVSDNDERSGKKLCTDESKAIDSREKTSFKLSDKHKEVKIRTTIKQLAKKRMGRR